MTDERARAEHHASIVEVQTTPPPVVVEAIPVQPEETLDLPPPRPVEKTDPATNGPSPAAARPPEETLRLEPGALAKEVAGSGVPEIVAAGMAAGAAAEAPQPEPTMKEDGRASPHRRIGMRAAMAAVAIGLVLIGALLLLYASLFAAASHHTAASKPTPPPPARLWFFLPLSTEPDQVFLELYNPNRTSARMSLQFLGASRAENQHLTLAGRAEGEVQLTAATCKLPLVVRASQPILTRRIVIVRGRASPSYGSTAVKIQEGLGR